MDIYHIWFNLKEGVKDTDFADAARAYFEHLKSKQSLVSYRITRRKLGLGHPSLPEWHAWLEFDGLAQIDQAFSNVASRANPVESFHQAVNSKVTDLMFALYRDFPDAVRQRGQERF
jgi:hypothetical protein